MKPIPRPHEAPNTGAESVPPGATRKAWDRPTNPPRGAPGSGGEPRHGSGDPGDGNELNDSRQRHHEDLAPDVGYIVEAEEHPPYSGLSGGAVSGTPAEKRGHGQGKQGRPDLSPGQPADELGLERLTQLCFAAARLDAVLLDDGFLSGQIQPADAAPLPVGNAGPGPAGGRDARRRPDRSGSGSSGDRDPRRERARPVSARSGADFRVKEAPCAPKLLAPLPRQSANSRKTIAPSGEFSENR